MYGPETPPRKRTRQANTGWTSGTLVFSLVGVISVVGCLAILAVKARNDILAPGDDTVRSFRVFSLPLTPLHHRLIPRPLPVPLPPVCYLLSFPCVLSSFFLFFLIFTAPPYPPNDEPAPRRIHVRPGDRVHDQAWPQERPVGHGLGFLRQVHHAQVSNCYYFLFC